MLLTNAEGRKRILKDAALILFAILMLVSIAVVISEFETGGHGTVYAVDSSSNEGSWQSQMGLTGVVTGVADMEKYSEATRLIRMDGAKGATLAGACGLDRRAIRKRQIASGTTKAKELGYYADHSGKPDVRRRILYVATDCGGRGDRWRCDEQDDGSRSRFEPREGFSLPGYDPGGRMAG